MRTMVSEDTENSLALIIVALSFLSVPLLLFLFVVTVYFNVDRIIQFYNTRTPADALLALLLAIVNIVLLFAIRRLIRWVRK
jgi:prepilin signal peptidase PulO-like enzyme (type II secretory pathway)